MSLVRTDVRLARPMGVHTLLIDKLINLIK